MDLLLFIVLLVCYRHIATVSGRTEVRVLVPPVVRRGSTVTLLCLHNVTGDNLYSVKWYRGNYEFYRFVPKERPPASTFPLPGLEVDMNGSSGQQVTVRVLSRHISGQFTCEVSAEEPYFSTSSDSYGMNGSSGQQVTVRVLSRHISGQFTCEVSAEEPYFSTSSDSANLTVIDIGLRKPLLIPASSVHVSGTPLQINCSAQPTVPPPHISFYIDDIKVDKKLVRTVKPGLATLELLRLSEEAGLQWVRCEASVGGVYHLSSASIPILEQYPAPDDPRNAMPKLTHSINLELLCLFVLVQYKVTKQFNF